MRPPRVSLLGFPKDILREYPMGDPAKSGRRHRIPNIVKLTWSYSTRLPWGTAKIIAAIPKEYVKIFNERGRLTLGSWLIIEPDNGEHWVGVVTNYSLETTTSPSGAIVTRLTIDAVNWLGYFNKIYFGIHLGQDKSIGTLYNQDGMREVIDIIKAAATTSLGYALQKAVKFVLNASVPGTDARIGNIVDVAFNSNTAHLAPGHTIAPIPGRDYSLALNLQRGVYGSTCARWLVNNFAATPYIEMIPLAYPLRARDPHADPSLPPPTNPGPMTLDKRRPKTGPTSHAQRPLGHRLVILYRVLPWLTHKLPTKPKATHTKGAGDSKNKNPKKQSTIHRVRRQTDQSTQPNQTSVNPEKGSGATTPLILASMYKPVWGSVLRHGVVVDQNKILHRKISYGINDRYWNAAVIHPAFTSDALDYVTRFGLTYTKDKEVESAGARLLNIHWPFINVVEENPYVLTALRTTLAWATEISMDLDRYAYGTITLPYTPQVKIGEGFRTRDNSIVGYVTKIEHSWIVSKVGQLVGRTTVELERMRCSN